MKFGRIANNALLAVLASALLGGCASVNYYAQAAQGQLSLMSGARPIDDWLGDDSTSAALKTRLVSARQIRAFAVSELGLPDNGSYKNYAAVPRPYVLWNVVAAPELSLKPIQWCFPVAGCVSYRGYYNKESAIAYAHQLRAQGKDVQVAGVPAYSTLGWFDDPLISTFIGYPDAELARLIFHELAHQVLYVKDDSRFNESFASAVEQAGVQRWLDGFGNQAMRERYLAYSGRKQQFLALLQNSRRALEGIYASPASLAEKRALKARTFLQLQADYLVLKESWGGFAGYDRFFAEPLSNAHLASLATYHDLVPGFRVMLEREPSFARFYAAARTLSRLDKDARHRQLKALAATSKSSLPIAASQQ
jgi:predicted aminopeptidase